LNLRHAIRRSIVGAHCIFTMTAICSVRCRRRLHSGAKNALAGVYAGEAEAQALLKLSLRRRHVAGAGPLSNTASTLQVPHETGFRLPV
jgi:hypothetical protein